MNTLNELIFKINTIMKHSIFCCEKRCILFECEIIAFQAFYMPLITKIFLCLSFEREALQKMHPQTPTTIHSPKS